jgi:hypothetical protein
MNTKLNLSLIVTLAALSTSVTAEETYWVALSSDVSKNRTSIADVGSGDKSVWIQRKYGKPISLGVDTQTGKDIYLHLSVQVHYVVNCAQHQLNITSWKLFAGANSQGEVVWADSIPSADADYRYQPFGDEEKSVAESICGSTVGTR